MKAKWIAIGIMLAILLAVTLIPEAKAEGEFNVFVPLVMREEGVVGEPVEVIMLTLEYGYECQAYRRFDLEGPRDNPVYTPYEVTCFDRALHSEQIMVGDVRYYWLDNGYDTSFLHDEGGDLTVVIVDHWIAFGLYPRH